MSDLPKFLPLDKDFDTKAIHSAYNPENHPDLGVIPPLVLSTTFHMPDVTKSQRFKYSRTGNPNRELLETTLAAIENAKFATCYASGVGAIAIVTHLIRSGDHILCIDDVYSGTYKYFKNVASHHGISVTYVDVTILDNVDLNLKPNTKMVWLETPSNPLMKIVDIKTVAERAKKFNPDIIVVVDNSFLSSYFLKPLDLGADVSVSSLTKYVNGHSDVSMGSIVTNNKVIHNELISLQTTCGAIPSPFDCYMVMRGIKTLGLRMRTHMINGYRLAKQLQRHPMVERLLYPGFPSHPGHEIALQQWHGISGMLSFYLKGGLKEAVYFTKCLKYFSTCFSYGGFESIVELPMLMSHAAIPKEELLKSGITENLIRMSVGLENVEDLIADVEQAFSAVARCCN